MPTPTGGETIGERLKRLRTSLERVRQTLARAENNGQENNIAGAQLTEIQYERALARQTKLENDIAALEARLAGNGARPGIAMLSTVMP